MTHLTFHPLAADIVAALRAKGVDAYGLAPERAVSSGDGMPYRHCLGNIAQGAAMLILAHRPFGALQPYAETGPIFLCADDCPAFDDERICYGTGKIVPPALIMSYAVQLFEQGEIAFVDFRSASNNCFLTRITAA